MENDWLKKALSRVDVPEADQVSRDRALDRALIALKNRETEMKAPAEGHWFWPQLGTLALVVLMAGLIVWLIPSAEFSKTAALEVLDQVAAEFPGKLEAVVERNGQVNVQLADEEIVSSAQPVLLVLKRGQERVRVLSYSGREVCLELNGRRTCLEMLAQDNGEVIVSGERFLWSRKNQAALDGYRIEASALSTAL